MATDILYIDKSRVFSGAESSLCQLLEKMDKSRFTPHICVDYPMAHQRSFKETGAKTICLAGNLKWWMGSERWDHPLRGTDLIKRHFLGFKIFQYLKKNKIKIVHHNLLFPNSFPDLFWAKKANVKIVGHVRSFGPSFILPGRLLKLCDACVCVSEAVKNTVSAWSESNNIHRVYNPVCVEKYRYKDNKQQAKIELGLPVDKRVISSIALLSPHKGHDVAIRAFAALAKAYDDILLYIAGGHASGKATGAEINRLRSLTSELKVSDRVMFSGRQLSNIEAVYAASDIVYALTVWGEGFGRVAPEAGAAKRIVIATDLGATPEIVVHQKTGFLVPPNQIEPVVSWSDQLLRNPEKFQHMAEAAHNRINELFSPVTHASQIQAIYEETLK